VVDLGRDPRPGGVAVTAGAGAGDVSGGFTRG
jgi:hypothetical protein